MKKTSKLLLTVLAVMLLSVALTVFASANTGINALYVDAETAESENDLGSVKWYPATDGSYYLFLPAGTDRSELTVWFTADGEVLCNGEKLISGEKTSVFAEGESFTLTCGAESYKVIVMTADNSGTIYINTESGNMDAVHNDKSYKEPGEILILDENGEVQYDGVLDYIKGRGNSTWTHPKKPYNIKLDKKTDLFGLGKDKSWCLLSNHSDSSLIKNRVVFDLARNLGVDFTTDSYNVNLYLNGEYAGLYLMTEKVDIGENRVDIFDLEGKTEEVNDKDLEDYPLGGKQNSSAKSNIKYAEIPNNPSNITGGYLLETEKTNRYKNEVSGFVTDRGQAIVVKNPEYASKAQVEYISSFYQDFEDALYSGTGYNGKGKHYSYYMDMDSLARVYLLLEFTSNFDGCSSSFFLYKDVDGKLKAGPAWDYDLSLGYSAPNNLINHVPNMGDPNLLYIQTCFIGNHAENKKSLLGQAFTHNDFQEKVQKLWTEKLIGLYPEFRSEIEAAKTSMKSSAAMNAIRWNIFGTTSTDTISNKYNSYIDNILKFTDARREFLGDAYSYDTYFVKYDIGEYGSAIVHDSTLYSKGSTATVLSAPEATSTNRIFSYWSTKPDGLGDKYEAGDKITVTDNVTLFAQWEDNGFFARIINAIRSFFERISEFFKNLFS
ncbi:MAG: CotH kinase family protein [Clostridia bacterium]|nr:CotH kinase family protein [Clostridia bacterium]